MSEKLFLRYANELFADDPENLIHVIQDLINMNRSFVDGSEKYRDHDIIRLDFLTENICIFSSLKDIDSVIKNKEKFLINALKKADDMGDINSREVENLVEMAFYAVFYFIDGDCLESAHKNEDGSCAGYLDIKHDFSVQDKNRVKCHECRQLFFRSMLSDLVLNNGPHRNRRIIKKGDNHFFDEEWFDKNLPDKNEFIINLAIKHTNYAA